MLNASKISQQLKNVFAFFPFSQKQQIINRPLLSNNDIIDLMLRVQNKKHSQTLHHDIAHRQLGDVSSVYRGQGMDYEESRHYQSGDDPRYMNWPLTARSGQHFMKVFREERQPGAFILIDRRASMRFGTRQQLKVTQAVKAAAITAFSALQNNFSVAGVIMDDDTIWFNENHNKQAVIDFIHQAAKPVIPVAEKSPRNEPSLHDILRTLNTVVTKGASITLISDFHDLDKQSQSSLFELAARHQVTAIQISDPAEINLPEAGLLSLHNSQSNKTTSINSLSTTDRERYKKAADSYFSDKQNLFSSSAVTYQQLFTTDDINKLFLL